MSIGLIALLDDVAAIAKVAAAARFDHYICRRDDSARGRVEDDVPHHSLHRRGRDSPIKADDLALPASILSERD
jgi:hypothetical protein